MPTITFDQLQGAGTLNPEDFLANTLYSIVMGAPICSGSAYFTMEAIRDADGYFDGSSAQPARSTLTNFVDINQDTLIAPQFTGDFGKHVWSIVIPPGGGTFDFTPNISPIFANTVLLRGTGGITFGYTRSAFVFTTKAQLVDAVNLWTGTPAERTAAIYAYGQINTWDVSAITDMASLFLNKTTFNDDISNWDVSSVTDMRNMFANTNTFNQPIGNWVVSSVTNMDSMFFGANAFNSNINDWDVSNVTNMGGMFAGAFAFQSPLNLWEVDSLTNADQFMGLTGNANAITYTLLDTLYNGWVVDIAAMQSNVTIGFGDSKFTSAGLAAKNILAGAPLNWTITDNGQV